MMSDTRKTKIGVAVSVNTAWQSAPLFYLTCSFFRRASTMCRICRARGLRGGHRAGLPFAVVGGTALGALEAGPCHVATEAGHVAAHGSARASDASFPPTDDAGRVRRVVVGAGVAGTCCAEELCRLRPEDRVTLITATDAVKVSGRGVYRGN